MEANYKDIRVKKIEGWSFIILGLISILFCSYDQLYMSYIVGRQYNSRIILIPVGILTIYLGQQMLKQKSSNILLIIILTIHLIELIFNKLIFDGIGDGGLNEILFQIPTVALIIFTLIKNRI
jgi:hypothetical protein